MSAQASDALPLQVAVALPALTKRSFYQVMLLLRTVGAVAPDNMQIDHVIDQAKQADNRAKTTLRVQRLSQNKDALADSRYNFCFQKFLDNCYVDKDAKYFKPKYYVLTMEQNEEHPKGSLDRFIDNGKMTEWIDHFEDLHAQQIPEDAVCGICNKGDGKIFVCESVDDETGTVCTCTEHAGCVGYAPGQDPSEALCANEVSSTGGSPN